jgi:hypothetical protein
MKMRDLPTPEQILEELADKTAAHMDRRATVAFDGALREMTRYHRFLLALNASQTPDGATFSFAEVAGDAWNKPHQDWIKQYRRLFERAADHIPDEGHYMRSLAYVPLQLLPGPNDPGIPPDITQGILDLGPMMMHRLEAWVTKRTVLDTPEGQSAEPRLSLAGTDARAYENILPALVGAWESLLERAPRLYNWGERPGHNDLQRWDAFRGSWPFLWQHLTNTAYCLAVAVWNEDEVGATLFREALVRWPQTFTFALDGAEDLPSQRYLFPDVMKMSWAAASSHATQFAHEHMPPLTPDQIYSNVIRAAHQDVLLLTAGLLLFWTMDKKQTSEIGSRTAWALLNREGGMEHRIRPASNGIRLQSLLLNMLRFEIAGDRYAEGSYAGELDNLVEVLDRTTERRVVPGRIYTPSTSHGREDILVSLTAMLVAAVPEAGDDGILRRISKLAENEEILPGGDSSLRAIVRELGLIKAILEEHSTQLERGISVLVPNVGTRENTGRLCKVVDEAKAAIEAKRRERLQERPIDPAKLEQIRANVEFALLNEPAKVPFFRDVQIEETTPSVPVEAREVVFTGFDKAGMVKPIMASPGLNFNDFLVTGTQEKAGLYAWEAFKRRSRIQKIVTAGVEDEAFWKEVTGLVEQIGPDPILVVSRRAEGRALRRFFYGDGGGLSDLKIERRPRNDVSGSYIVTVEGVDVFGDEVPVGTSWLFSRQALQRILYAKLDTPDMYVGIDFELREGEKVELRLGFSQQFIWSEKPIFEISGPDPNETGEAIEP